MSIFDQDNLPQIFVEFLKKNLIELKNQVKKMEKESKTMTKLSQKLQEQQQKNKILHKKNTLLQAKINQMQQVISESSISGLISDVQSQISYMMQNHQNLEMNFYKKQQMVQNKKEYHQQKNLLQNRNIFQQADINGDGFISKKEFNDICQVYQKFLLIGQIDQLYQKFGQNNGDDEYIVMWYTFDKMFASLSEFQEKKRKDKNQLRKSLKKYEKGYEITVRDLNDNEVKFMVDPEERVKYVEYYLKCDQRFEKYFEESQVFIVNWQENVELVNEYVRNQKFGEILKNFSSDNYCFMICN